MTSGVRSHARWWGPALILMVVIFALSSRPTLPMPDLGANSDKKVHGAVYGLLAILVARALARGDVARMRVGVLVGAWAITTLYGASDEWHQRFVPGRSADWLDLAADSAGAFAALSALWACGILHRSRQAAPS